MPPRAWPDPHQPRFMPWVIPLPQDPQDDTPPENWPRHPTSLRCLFCYKKGKSAEEEELGCKDWCEAHALANGKNNKCKKRWLSVAELDRIINLRRELMQRNNLQEHADPSSGLHTFFRTPVGTDPAKRRVAENIMEDLREIWCGDINELSRHASENEIGPQAADAEQIRQGKIDEELENWIEGHVDVAVQAPRLQQGRATRVAQAPRPVQGMMYMPPAQVGMMPPGPGQQPHIMTPHVMPPARAPPGFRPPLPPVVGHPFNIPGAHPGLRPAFHNPLMATIPTRPPPAAIPTRPGHMVPPQGRNHINMRGGAQSQAPPAGRGRRDVIRRPLQSALVEEEEEAVEAQDTMHDEQMDPDELDDLIYAEDGVYAGEDDEDALYEDDGQPSRRREALERELRDLCNSSPQHQITEAEEGEILDEQDLNENLGDGEYDDVYGIDDGLGDEEYADQDAGAVYDEEENLEAAEGDYGEDGLEYEQNIFDEDNIGGEYEEDIGEQEEEPEPVSVPKPTRIEMQVGIREQLQKKRDDLLKRLKAKKETTAAAPRERSPRRQTTVSPNPFINNRGGRLRR